jgi:membrane protease YdiL (CAAX protease family)
VASGLLADGRLSELVPVLGGNRKGESDMGSRLLGKLPVPQAAVILLLVPILLTVWVYYGKQAHFEQLFTTPEGRWNPDVFSAIYEYIMAFLLMFCIPALVVKVVFKENLRDFGVQLGNWRTGLCFVAIGSPILLAIAWAGSSDVAIQAEYPLAKSTMRNLPLLLVVEIVYLVYYVGWEFFFRGVMLFGLEGQYDAVTGILVQTIPSTIVHIGKPASENFAAILAGLAFGYMAIRTRSILYPLVLHAIVGIGTDVFVTLRLT